MTPTRPILRYHGGKWQLAEWIIGHMPHHRVYVEPFGGAASVLLRKDRTYAEVYNDLDGEIVNLFRVARDHGRQLKRALSLTPYSRREFERSFASVKDPVEQARRTLVRGYMGYGGNLTRMNRDLTPQHTGFRSYTGVNRGSTPASEWRGFNAALTLITDRLQGVVIESRDAVKVMEEHDGDATLHYVDPPYVHSTRSLGAACDRRGYRFEMSDDQHRRLAAALHTLQGGVIVSGYACDLYDRELYAGWRRVERAAMADGGRARTEVLWMRNINTELF